MPKIEKRLTEVQMRIQQALKDCQRPADATQLLAVSKTKPAELIREAYDAGQRSFGENYLQEALHKQEKLSGLSLEWHFIGPIQSNKTRPLAENFDWVHSVDRLKIAQRLSDQRPDGQPPLNICLQVNVDDEASKSGVSLVELPELLASCHNLPKLRVRGLMCIPMPAQGFDEQKRSFDKLVAAFNDLKQRHPELDTLSMGMSGDLEAAIAAGSTMVRIGTDIFGARTPENHR